MLEPGSQSLEIAKLIVATLAPISIVGLGWFANRRFKEIEQIQWKNRKVIDKRIEIFDRLAPEVNRLYCYFMWIGEWQNVTPQQVIAAKRALDRGFHINRYIIGDGVFDAWQRLADLMFRMNTRPGRDALIRAALASPNGDRRTSPYYQWDPAWTEYFDEASVEDRGKIQEAYGDLMRHFQSQIGL